MRAPKLLSNDRSRSLRDRLRFSKIKLLSHALTISIIGLSITLVVVTAASIAWVSNYHRNGNGVVRLVEHNYTYGAYGYSRPNATWRNTVYYNADRLRMDDVYAMLAGGCLGALIGLLLLSLPFWLQRSHEVELSLPCLRRKTRKIDLTHQTATIALDAVLSILFLVVASIAFSRSSRAPFSRIYSLPDWQLDHTIDMGPPPGATFESWNCAFDSGYVEPNATAPSAGDLRLQCTNATISRQLVIPLMVLAVVRLGLRPMATAFGIMFRPPVDEFMEFMEWRKHKRDMREGKGTELNDVRPKRLEDEESGGQGRSSVQEESGSGQSFIAELPGWRMSRAEMDQDTAVVEAPGAEGGKEMDAGIAAVEKDAGERDSEGKS